MAHSITLQRSAAGHVVNNDILGQISFAAPNEPDGTDAIAIAASIFARSEGTFAADNNATELVFLTGTTESASPGATTYDMTLSSAGNLTLAGNLVIPDAGNIGSASDLNAIAIASDGVVTMDQIPVFSAGINVSGGTIAGTIATATQNSITTMTGLVTVGTIGTGVWNGTAIATTYIANDAITSGKIAADAINGTKITNDAINSEHYATGSIDTAHIADAQVTLAKIASQAANTVLVRDANSSGVVSAKALATTQILIGDGTGFTVAALSGDVTMTNAGVVSLAAGAVDIAHLSATGTAGSSNFLRGDNSWVTPTDTNTTYAKADFDLDHLFTLVGAAADTSVDLGTFTGSTVANSVTIKVALQSLETAVETKGVTAGSSSIVTVGTIGAGIWQGTDVAVAHGGTGVSTLTDGGILLGSGTGAITALAVLGNGVIVVGDNSTDPTTITAFTASDGVLKHEVGGLELDISGIAIGDVLAGTGTGAVGIVTSTGHADGQVLTLQADGTADWEPPAGGGSGDITGVTLAGDSSTAQDLTANVNLTLAGGNGITTAGDGSATISIALDAALTTVTSLLATDIKIGEDDQTKIDFETADEIHFYAANVEQVYLADNIFGPQSDSDVDLGTTGVRWKDAYIDTITTTGDVDVLGNIELGHASDTTIARASAGQITVEGTAVILAGAVTGITSLLATDIKIGEDDQTKIDFETADEIHFFAANVEQVYLADNIFGPQSDSDVDLGTTGVRWKDAFIDTITTTGAITAGGIVTGTGFTAGSAVLAEAELELLDGLTAGTAIASKVVTTDASIDTTGQRNLTISGELDAATLDISGNVDIAGTTNLDAVDIDGNVQLDGTLTVGADTDGYDVKLFGDTAGMFMQWDESLDLLNVKGSYRNEIGNPTNTPAVAYNGTVALADSGATIDIDWQKSNCHWVRLGQNVAVTKIVFSNMFRGGRYILRIQQNNTTASTVSWGDVDGGNASVGAMTEVRWVGGTAPTMSTGTTSTDVYGFLCTRSNGRGVDGFVIAQDLQEDGAH
jgi:hypothetical protein